MAEQSNSPYNIKDKPTWDGKRTKGRKSFFFLDDKLYKMLTQNKSANLIRVRDFEDDTIKDFILTDVKRNMKNAYDTVEVAQMLNRTRAVIQLYIMQGFIKPPKKIYQHGRNAYGHPFSTMKWKDQDILDLHEALLYHGGGRPRKDGKLYKGPRLPNRQELLAMLRNTPRFYMQTSDGEMVPVWSAYNEV